MISFNSPPRETFLMRGLMSRAAVQIPDLRLFRRNVGTMQLNGRVFKAGIKGQADIYGYIKGGQVIEIETKSARGTLNENQERWKAWCEGWGIRYVLLKRIPNEHHLDTVRRWIAELKEIVAEKKARAVRPGLSRGDESQEGIATIP